MTKTSKYAGLTLLTPTSTKKSEVYDAGTRYTTKFVGVYLSMFLVIVIAIVASVVRTRVVTAFVSQSYYPFATVKFTYSHQQHILSSQQRRVMCKARKSTSREKNTEDPSSVTHRPSKRCKIAPTRRYKETDPSTWDHDTPPYMAVRHFAPAYVDSDSVRNKLKDLSIETMKDLKRRTRDLGYVLKSSATYEFEKAVDEALRRVVNNTPEDVLGGLLFYNDSCLDDGSLATYSATSVSVMPMEVNGPVPSFSMVQGPMGSGKTLFAIHRLPELIFPYNKGRRLDFFSEFAPKSEVLSIHFPAEHVVAIMSTTNMDFPQAVTDIVNRQIANDLSGLTFWASKFVTLGLHVIIDDAGSESTKAFFKSSSQIQAIVDALKTIPITFRKGIHVAVVGTGLQTDFTNRNDTSVVFRMQPWNFGHFDAMVIASGSVGRTKVRDVVRDTPVLQAMFSNARCARHLQNINDELWKDLQKWTKGLANVIIADVVKRYVASTDLKYLTSKTCKWAFVRSVFAKLEEATSHPGVAFVPRFDDLGDARLRAMAASLLDIDVLSIGGRLVLADDCSYSLSISHAHLMVLIYLLNSDYDITWDWQALETSVMLTEWKRMITHWHDIPSQVESEQTTIQVPYLLLEEGETADEFVLPVVNTYTVVQNRPGTQFASIIAPYRLVQTMFSIDKTKTQKIEWTAELGKLGLLKVLKLRMQQAATSVLYVMWKSQHEAISASDGVVVPAAVSECRTEAYPYQGLPSRTACIAEVVCQFKKGGLVSYRQKNDPMEQTKEVKVKTSFIKKRPVTAVFVTNCKTFELQMEGTKAFKVGPDDVDWEGRLTEKTLPVEMVSTLRANVEIRFHFC